jgi:hypothetical protein
MEIEMKFKLEFEVDLNDETLNALIDEMEGKLTEAIFEIEEEQMQSLMDLIGGTVPVIDDDDEVMEKAFDLIQEIQSHIFWTAMKRWNLYLKPKTKESRASGLIVIKN